MVGTHAFRSGSSGRQRTPRRRASSLVAAYGASSTTISPPASVRCPASTSTSSSCPLPDTPAMPTISPARTSSVTPSRTPTPRSSTARTARSARLTLPGSRLDRDAERARRLSAHHHRRHVRRREVVHAPLPRDAPSAKDGHLVGEARHLPELVRDHQNAELARLRHRAEHPEHLVGLRGSEDARRFVEDENAVAEVELLEDLELLALARGERADDARGVDLERHVRHERPQVVALRAPVDHEGQNGARQDEVLGHAHVRHEREVLVDHAHAERLRLARALDLHLGAVDEDPAGVRRLVAHDAFDDRALSGAVLAEERVEGARGERQRDVVEDDERPESLADAERRELGGCRAARARRPLPCRTRRRGRGRLRDRRRHRAAASSAGWPASVRVAELVATMIPRVRTYGTALKR